MEASAIIAIASAIFSGIALIIGAAKKAQDDNLQKKLEILQEDNSNLSRKLETVKKENEDRYQDFQKDYTMQLEVVRNQRDQAEKEREELSQRLINIQKQVSIIEEANRLCDKQHENALKEIRQLKEILDNKVAKNKELRQENKVLKTRIEILEKEVENLKINTNN